LFGAAAAAAAQRSVDNEEVKFGGMRSLKRERWNVERGERWCEGVWKIFN
jgi:hypothetical protein